MLDMVSVETIMISTENLCERFVPMPPANNRTASPLEAHTGYWLRVISNRVSSSFARALQDRQMSVAEWVALNEISFQRELTPATLADSMCMTRGAITKVLDKMEAKHWVTRTASSDDKRVQYLALTRSGKNILPVLTGIADTNDRFFFDVLSTAEQAQLRGLLQKLAQIHQIRDVAVD